MATFPLSFFHILCRQDKKLGSKMGKWHDISTTETRPNATKQTSVQSKPIKLGPSHTNAIDVDFKDLCSS